MVTEFPYLQLIFKSVNVDVREIFPIEIFSALHRYLLVQSQQLKHQDNV